MNDSEQMNRFYNNFYGGCDSFINTWQKNHFQITLHSEVERRERLKQYINLLHKVINDYLSKRYEFKFTRSEATVIAFLTAGKTLQQISDLLVQSKRTIENKLQAVRFKMDCRSSFQVAFIMINSSIVNYINRIVSLYESV